MTARSFCLGPFPQWGLFGWAHFPALLTELWEKSFMGIWPNNPVHWVVTGVGLCLLYLPILMLLLKCPLSSWFSLIPFIVGLQGRPNSSSLKPS